MKRRNHRAGERKQQGAALVVSMILLLIMTMIGTTGMRMSMQNLQISKGFRDYDYAFQFAETGLRLAENILESSEDSVNARALLTAANIGETLSDSYVNPTSWSSVQVYSDDFPVKIVVQLWNQVPDSLGVGKEPVTTTYYYRITARSFDPAYQAYLEGGGLENIQNGRSQSVLQSIYAVRFQN